MLELEEGLGFEVRFLTWACPATPSSGSPTTKCLCPTEGLPYPSGLFLASPGSLGPHCTWLPGPSRLCECVSGLRRSACMFPICVV